MGSDPTGADAEAETSEPLGFADVRVVAIAERARIELSAWRTYGNGRPPPGHIWTANVKPGLIFRPPYWMVIADTGS